MVSSLAALKLFCILATPWRQQTFQAVDIISKQQAKEMLDNSGI